MENGLQNLYNAILEGDAPITEKEVTIALEAGLDPERILNMGMIAAMKEVGNLFEQGEYFVPEMLIAARAMQRGMAILKPFLQQANVVSAGKVVIGTVKGDLHDIGKNLVSLMLEGAGFEIHDLGTDVSPEEFVQAVLATGAEIVALSALLTTTMPNMKSTLDSLTKAGLRDRVKVIVGGAPVTEQFSMQIGADGSAADASRAVSLAQSLIE